MNNTRDPMVLINDGTCYYYYLEHLTTDHTFKFKSAMFCLTLKDLKKWGNVEMVSAGGMVAELYHWVGGDAECRFVIPIEDQYVLFRNQVYLPDHLNKQCCSPNSSNFGVDNDKYMISQLRVTTTEIINYGDD